MDALQAALVARGWRMWVPAAIVGAVVFHTLHPAAAAWAWYHSLRSSVQESLLAGLGVPSLEPGVSLWSLAWGALSGAFSFLFAAQGATPRSTFTLRVPGALQRQLLNVEPGTFLYEMYWLVVPAAIVGGIGLISTLLNSPIAQPGLRWIKAHKKATGAIVFQAIATVLLADGVADMLASPETAPSPFRGIALLSTGIVCMSAALSLVLEKFMYLAFPTTSLLLIKAWGTFLAYCSFTLSTRRGESGAGLLYRLAGIGVAILTVAITDAARHWWTHDWQRRFENILFRAIGLTHIIGTTITALALGVWPFTWHVLPVLLVSVVEVTGILQKEAVINFSRAFMAMAYMVTVNTSLLFASHACIRWAFTFLDAPLFSLRFWLVNLWIFLFLMAFPVLAVFAAWLVVNATHDHAPKAYKALWLVFDFAARSFLPMLKMAVRLGGLALLEVAGTCLVEGPLLEPHLDLMAWITGLGSVIGLCMVINSVVLRTMSMFRDLKCAELPLGVGAGIIHAATRILLADTSPTTIALCTPLLAAAAIPHDASFGWPTTTAVYNRLLGPMLAAKRAAIAVATRMYHAVHVVFRHLAAAARTSARATKTALVWTAMRLRSVVRAATPLLQAGAGAVVTALFLRPLLTKPSLTLSDLAFLLSAWAGTCSTVILTGAALRSRRIHALGLRMFDKVDFGLALLTIHILTASFVQLARLLRVLTELVQRVLRVLSNVVYNLWSTIARGIRTVARAGVAQFSLIWRNPFVAMASAAVVIAIAYQVHTLGLRPQGAVDVAWDLTLALWDALCSAAGLLLSLHEMMRPFMARAVREVVVWRQAMVGSASSADLFRMVSFAWVFYLGCVVVSVTKLHRRMRSKTIAVPIMVLYVTAYLAPGMFNVVALLLLLWMLGSIIVWEQDLAERRRADAQWVQVQARHMQRRGASGERRFVVPETDASEFTEQVYEADECVICQEAFEEDTRGYTLPCGHRAFHRECLNDWFSACTNARCPICRAPADQRTQWLQTVF